MYESQAHTIKEEIIRKLKQPSAPVQALGIQETTREIEEVRAHITLDLQERREILKMRGEWSSVVKWCILAVILFDIIAITLIGLGIFKFSNQFEVPILFAESVIKVVGLAYIVVRFLFSEDSIQSNKKRPR